MKSTLFMLFVFFSAVAHAADYDVDPGHSGVGFEIRHLMSKVRGTFPEFSGSFNYDEKTPEKSAVKFVVKAASINTHNAKRDEHLRGDDFFSAKKFPEATFVSTKFEPDSSNKKLAKMAGNLTIHGVTKPVVFEVSYLGAGKDPWGNERAGFEATTKLNRKDFGISWNKALDQGALVLGDDVTLTIDVEGSKKAAK